MRGYPICSVPQSINTAVGLCLQTRLVFQTKVPVCICPVSGFETAETREELIFIENNASTRASCIFQPIDESLSARNICVNELRCVSFHGAPICLLMKMVFMG